MEIYGKCHSDKFGHPAKGIHPCMEVNTPFFSGPILFVASHNPKDLSEKLKGGGIDDF